MNVVFDVNDGIVYLGAEVVDHRSRCDVTVTVSADRFGALHNPTPSLIAPSPTPHARHPSVDEGAAHVSE